MKPTVPDETDASPDPNNAISADTLYQTASQHWAHAEQVRWTLLCNFLMAATILLLAWAAVFAGTNPTVIIMKNIALGFFAGIGLLISVLWVGLSERASGFVAVYNKCGRELECLQSSKLQGPFQRAELHRDKIPLAARYAQSRSVAIIIPTLFALLFLALLVISIMA